MFQDPILQKLIDTYPSPTWTDRSDFLFEDLIETIISQQLSIKAADSIYNRFKKLFPLSTFPTPEQVLAIDHETLRSIGVSHSKANYIHNVAQAFVDKTIESEKIKMMADEEIIEQLIQIKGVGKWTAEMILIFTLNRPDVFSVGDLGLRNAIKNLYQLSEKEDILNLVETWSPHKSLASWYLWRSLENK